MGGSRETFYLAGRWDRRAELRVYEAILIGLGYTSRCGWLHETVTDPKVNTSRDIEDILRSEMVAFFCDEPEGQPKTGGNRFAEFGICLAEERRNPNVKWYGLVGPDEIMFHSCVSKHRRFKDESAFLGWMDWRTRPAFTGSCEACQDSYRSWIPAVAKSFRPEPKETPKTTKGTSASSPTTPCSELLAITKLEPRSTIEITGDEAYLCQDSCPHYVVILPSSERTILKITLPRPSSTPLA